jgi:hypothetical protein
MGTSRLRIGASLAVTAVLVSACTGERDAALPQPAPESPGPTVAQAPGPREGHDLEFLPALRRVVLLEGAGTTDHPWTWDGSAWEPLVTEGGPATRFLGGSAYWPRRSALVSYGGLNEEGNVIPETWKFDGSRWVEHEDGGRPSATDHFSLEYDGSSDAVLLFGGRTDRGRISDETWTWDGEAWERVTAPGPPARIHGAMAYDPAARHVVLFGGDASLQGGPLLSDTWVWADGTWADLDITSGPVPRADAAIESHPAAGGVVLFGGATRGGGYPRDTWVLQGDEWRRLRTSVAPPGRVAHDMTYEPLRDVIVLYGGFAGDRTFTDVWEFDGREWKEVTPAA